MLIRLPVAVVVMRDVRGTTVLDVTYMCNATCRYCRWGDDATPGRVARNLDELLVSEETLKMLGTRRVVLSGGEPRLHPHLDHILEYYGGLVDQVVVISNGYGLDRTVAKRLRAAGATGITISLDSIDAAESFLVRRTPPALHREILNNVADIAGLDCELGINCTVCRVTANWITVNGMLEFGADMGVDFVKFQPIFDDGYVGTHSKDLLLQSDDAPYLLDIASRLESIRHPPTNPPGFWTDVAALAAGLDLPPAKCALGGSDAISVGGRMAICYWVESSYYSSPNGMLRDPETVRRRFEADKMRCRVGNHCFCNQGMEHVWIQQ